MTDNANSASHRVGSDAIQIVRLEEWDCLSVEIRHHAIRAGFYETGEPFIAAEVRLEGTVFDTRFDQPKSNVAVMVDIDCAPEQQADDEGYEPGDEDHPDGIPEGYDLGASYIGHIKVLLPSGARTNVKINVHLFLPLSVFSLLMSLKGTSIKLSTIHDSIVNPKVALNSYIAGYVKRVEFEPQEER